ncbi:IclR family transcriptional regulator [Natranaerobius thermophilus]|uniref:Transcriptional regulator, IclR family n=1 Tax=Natranaerobius thermophilus (strain ATCC BAA-1301 / DSM 18059 / JW/NM-WN-LF) TaxID=457570 RepID=B2A2B9_NATTJ|nr:IclR family transcriptional regulator [Natranaerobius thermophilus]ACB86225.1 transcriptional regulator, IclR family [Natranaerobius thermophilus JW/NM-WN-LF]
MTQQEKLSSNRKAIKVLKALAQEPYEFSAKEISEQLNINRTSVHRILNDYMQEKLVTQNRYTKKYKLGPETFKIGAAYLNVKNINNDIVGIVNEIATKTKESVGLYVKDEDVIISLYESESFQLQKMGYKAGSTYPINAGSVGKCITAFLDEERIEELLENTKLEQYTSHTITDKEELRKEFKQIRAQGYAISDEDKVLGRYGIAAPVWNSQGHVVASVAVACQKTGLTTNKIETIKNNILKGAEEISDLMP